VPSLNSPTVASDRTPNQQSDRTWFFYFATLCGVILIALFMNIPAHAQIHLDTGDLIELIDYSNSLVSVIGNFVTYPPIDIYT